MWLVSIVLVSLWAGSSYGVLYDAYTGEPATKCLLSYYAKNNLTNTCAIDVKPCDPNEYSRVDGTCNNLEHPGKGTYFSPITRILDACFHNGYEQRKAKSGKDLPLAREVRVKCLGEKVSSHPLYNHNVPGFGIYMFNDIGSVHDIENMLLNTTYCCEKEHMNDRACTPNIVKEDDPVFRYSPIRCMNSTRPLTHQDFGCTRDKVPSIIKKATTFFDHSQIYNVHGKGDKVIRSFIDGKLLVEEEDGKPFPPNGPTAFCPNNKAPEETRCFENYGNTLLPVALYIIWFVRHHNYICDKLKEVNPCWDDERLFYTARDINTAFANQMYFQEWYETLQGRKNLIKAGVMTKENGFRCLYDKNRDPEVTIEYTYVIRWFHLMQEEKAKMYDKQGNYVEDFPLFNSTFRMGLIAKNMESFTKSTLAPCHAVDGTVASDLANRGLPGVQEALDIPAGDLNKGRNFGVAPYVNYIYHFTGIKIKSFKELARFIQEEYIEILEELYEDVEDIDLMVGLWCSKMMKGGHIPELLAYILNDAWYRSVSSNRHWYECDERPHAFTEAQLKEVRKATVSGLLCTVGDGVHEMPKKGFLKISKKNPMVSCSRIPKINFRVWADDACKPKKHQKNGKKPNKH
ncbi:hypothetical protein PYW07_015641 [Mythimna separata]|uniref:Peroxidase n=1 Tax=Mythimna separata TaxID=271217 RepID=A0AAD7Z0E9_MYTSE|nr:hypothetical protein PYW07_015641 [Mythimna separata]